MIDSSSRPAQSTLDFNTNPPEFTSKWWSGHVVDYFSLNRGMNESCLTKYPFRTCASFYSLLKGPRRRFQSTEAPHALQRAVRHGVSVGGAGVGCDPVRNRGASPRRRVRGARGDGLHLHRLLRAHVLCFGVRDVCDCCCACVGYCFVSTCRVVLCLYLGLFAEWGCVNSACFLDDFRLCFVKDCLELSVFRVNVFGGRCVCDRHSKDSRKRRGVFTSLVFVANIVDVYDAFR